MSKSLRNQLVDWAYEALLMLITEDESEELFIASGFSQRVVPETTTTGIEVIVTGVNPVMVMNAVLPTATLVEKLDTSLEVTPSGPSKIVSCSGYSKLKAGDEWSGYEGYKICAKRASREFAEQLLVPAENIISECVNRILDEEAMIAEIEEAFFTGDFGDLELLDEEE